MNPEGMVALLDYREDGITPYLMSVAISASLNDLYSHYL